MAWPADLTAEVRSVPAEVCGRVLGADPQEAYGRAAAADPAGASASLLTGVSTMGVAVRLPG
jgi:hypothetical protein